MPNESFSQPANIEIEQSLLGSVILNPDTLRFAEGIVSAEDFLEPVHREIWRVVLDSHVAGRKIDLRLVIAALGETSELKLLGKSSDNALTVKQYVARLVTESAVPMMVADYAQGVRDLSDQRRIGAVGAALRRENPEDPDKLAVDGIDALDAIIATRSKGNQIGRVTMRQALVMAVDSTAKAYQNNGAPTGVAWEIGDLDHKTLGMQPGELVILAGRPGMGKSAVAASCCRQIAEKGKKVLLASLEMSAGPLAHRILSDKLYDSGSIPYFKMRSGRISPDEFDRIAQAAREIEDIPLTIDQRGGLTFAQIASMTRQMKRKSGLDLLVVDHLQLIAASGRYSGQRVREVGESTAAAKMLAKELNIPVLMLCQLNRGIESRQDKRPVLSDLRESGEIEQDADTVIMVYRESYYLMSSEPEAGSEAHLKWQAAMEKAVNKCDLILAKQRNGPVGSVQIFLSVEHNAVRNLSDDQFLPKRGEN
jgi:replicative DNA helicase